MWTVSMHGADHDSVSEREIVVPRFIDAPRHLVFEAYTEKRHVSQWWGPRGFTTSTRSFEFRPGGVWEFTMHGPDATDYPNWIEWVEIVEPRLIVYRQGVGPNDPDAFVSTVTIEERGNRSEVTIRTVFNTKEQRDEVVKRYHAIEGAEETLGRLAEYMVGIND